jgi:CsoR family transcriptional regulator, copper-sensing transcriptional repressor
VTIAGSNLKKWCASPKPTKPPLAHPVRVRIPKRKSHLLLHLEIHSVEPVFRPAALAALAAASVELDKPLTGREPVFFFKSKPMKIQNPEAKEKLIQRLRRIEGQVRGVQNMLDEERDCREIMQQLAAIHSAVQGSSRTFIQEYAAVCLVEMDGTLSLEGGASPKEQREKIIQDMIALLDKAP